MLMMGGFLAGLLLALFYTALPVIIIVLIISLIIRSVRKNSTPTPTGNNSSSLNVLLYIGSFLIIGSMFLFIKDEPELMPVALIAVTLLAYLAGITIYRLVSYLRPVAIAFTYTSIILFPFWYYAFQELGMAGDSSFFLSSLISLFAYIGAATGVESRAAGWLSYLWLIIAGWALGNTIDGNTYNRVALSYAFYIWPLIVAFIPNILWQMRVTWLPVAFRQATKALAGVLAPVFAIISLTLLFVPNVGSDYPFLRTLAFLFASGNLLVSWFCSKSRFQLVALRLCVQAFILCIVADTGNYSIIAYGSNFDASSSLAIVIAWIISFLAQTICALFTPQRNEEERRAESIMLAVSLIGIFITPMLCAKFEQEPRAIMEIVIAGVVAALGILIGIRYKNVKWGIATVIALAAIPALINEELLPVRLNGWVLFTIYAILSFIYLAIFAIIHLKQPKNSIPVAVAGIAACGLGCIIAASIEGWSSAGWLLTSVNIVIMSLITGNMSSLEVSIYIAAGAAYVFIGDIYSSTHSGTFSYYLSSDSKDALLCDALRAHVVSLPLIGIGLWKERGQKSSPRIIIGYILFSYFMWAVTWRCYESKYLVYPLIFIIEEAALLVCGVLAKRTWMTISSSILIAITTLRMTDGSQALWIMLIGVGLIGIVAWQLTKNAKKSAAPVAKPEAPKEISEPAQEELPENTESNNNE